MNTIDITSNTKNSILAFIKNIVSKRLYKGIKVLLNPCCIVSITDLEYDCGTSELTLTISPGQPLLGLASAKVFSDDNGFIGDGVISNNGKTITVTADSDPVGADQVFTAYIFLPTDFEENQGVYQIATGTFTVVPC